MGNATCGSAPHRYRTWMPHMIELDTATMMLRHPSSISGSTHQLSEWYASFAKHSPPPPVLSLPLNAGIRGRDISWLPHLVYFLHSCLRTRIPHLHISLCVAGTRPPALCYTRARQRRKGAGAYERSRVHLTTTSLSCLTGDGILLPYPPHLNPPHQTRDL